MNVFSRDTFLSKAFPLSWEVHHLPTYQSHLSALLHELSDLKSPDHSQLLATQASHAYRCFIQSKVNATIHGLQPDVFKTDSEESRIDPMESNLLPVVKQRIKDILSKGKQADSGSGSYCYDSMMGGDEPEAKPGVEGWPLVLADAVGAVVADEQIHRVVEHMEDGQIMKKARELLRESVEARAVLAIMSPPPPREGATVEQRLSKIRR